MSDPIMHTLTIVIPIYNEEESIPFLIKRLHTLEESLRTHVQLEIILVDDHSNDQTQSLLQEICTGHQTYNYVRLARNSGSHIAILAGMNHAGGDCAVFLAADLQDPPELIPQMLERWRAGSHIVWAIRQEREGISWRDQTISNAFYRILNRLSDIQYPPQGSDFALIDRMVVDALLQSVGANPSLGVEIARLGFQQSTIKYVKEQRQYGTSKWSLERKLLAFADALVTTSYVPLRLMSYLGIISSALGFLYAVVVIILRFISQNPIEGWSALMVVVLVFGGIQMIMLGVIGEYLWRTLEQSRKRPLYFIENRSEPVQSNEPQNSNIERTT